MATWEINHLFCVNTDIILSRLLFVEVLYQIFIYFVTSAISFTSLVISFLNNLNSFVQMHGFILFTLYYVSVTTKKDTLSLNNFAARS